MAANGNDRLGNRRHPNRVYSEQPPLTGSDSGCPSQEARGVSPFRSIDILVGVPDNPEQESTSAATVRNWMLPGAAPVSVSTEERTVP